MAVLVAEPLEAPNAREARAAVRLSMAKLMQAASALETVYSGAEGGIVAVMERGGVVQCLPAKGEVCQGKHLPLQRFKADWLSGRSRKSPNERRPSSLPHRVYYNYMHCSILRSKASRLEDHKAWKSR